jgi:hypothetical protein
VPRVWVWGDDSNAKSHCGRRFDKLQTRFGAHAVNGQPTFSLHCRYLERICQPPVRPATPANGCAASPSALRQCAFASPRPWP